MSVKKISLFGIFLMCLSLTPILAKEISNSEISPKYRKWLDQEVVYIITPKEKEVFLKLSKDEERDLFIESFWKHRDPNPLTPENEFRTEHYRRLSYANSKFRINSSLPGWKTEAGRNYVLLGDPNPDVRLDIKLRFFEGQKEGLAAPPQVIISSYLKPTVSASIRSEFDLVKQQNQIKKVFNLKDVRLLTEADLRWRKAETESDKIFHIFRLDSKEYLVLITPERKEWEHRFRIEVFEQSSKGKRDLLDTEIILPAKNIAVFGFEDSQGKPYFLSFHVAGGVIGSVVGGVLGGVVGDVEGGVKGEIEGALTGQEMEEFAKGAVKVEKDIKPPLLLKMVEPSYPEDARKARIEGVVILAARTNEKGDVERVMVLRSTPLLDQAAIDAVRQWKYEPLIIEGKPKPGVFTITVRFKLKDEEQKKEIEEFEKGAVKAEGVIKPPRLIKMVNPIYPEEARKKKVEGIVILSARTNEKGDVERVMVLRSVPLLDEAAIDAVRQWKYEPTIIDGKLRSIIFTVTVRFQLK